MTIILNEGCVYLENGDERMTCNTCSYYLHCLPACCRGIITLFFAPADYYKVI